MGQIIINNYGSQKAGTISILRRYTGIGLKAAKDAVESIESGNFLVITDIPDTDIATVLADFYAYGVSASKNSDIAYGTTLNQLKYSKEAVAQASISDNIRRDAEQARLGSLHRNGFQLPWLDHPSPTVSGKVQSSELDRNALKIYLYDVLTLECINNKYQTKIRKLANQITSVNNISYVKEYKIDIYGTGNKSDQLYLKYNGNKYYVAVYSNSSYNYNKIYFNSWLAKDCYLWLEIESNLIYLHSLNAYGDYGTGFFDKIKYKKNAIKGFEEAYINFKAIAPNAYQKLLCNNSLMTKERIGLNKELDAVQRLLAKAYSSNIIPGAFRNNLYAIYYLYDFINTSNESFSTALLHYDLNEIKTRLDKIIAQQQEIIIQQSLIMAQNSQLLAQNQTYLKKLSNIEVSSAQTAYNTAQSAYYTEIAANNSEVCAWLGLANYLKD